MRLKERFGFFFLNGCEDMSSGLLIGENSGLELQLSQIYPNGSKQDDGFGQQPGDKAPHR